MCNFAVNFDAKTSGFSPGRVDALVWAITELMLGEPFEGWTAHFSAMAANRGKIERPDGEAKPESVAHALALAAAPAPPQRTTVTLHAPGPWAHVVLQNTSCMSETP